MKWKTNKGVEGFITKKWFAIFPVTIKGETRWLETVTVRGERWIGRSSGVVYFEKHKFID